MRQRSEIAAGADGAFFGNDRIDPPVEHFTKQLDDLATDSAQAEREDVRAQQHHRAHLRLRKRISNSTGVTADEVRLKLAQFFARNADLSELANYKLPGTRTYFLPVFCGGGITSLCCAQAPNPKAVTRRATIMILFNSFNLSRLLSQQVAPVCLGREEQGSNAFS